MSAITVNTFPAVNSFTSARSWFLAAIVLLHAAFFWGLSNGLSFTQVLKGPTTTLIEFLPTRKHQPPPSPPLDEQVSIDHNVLRKPELPRVQFDEPEKRQEQEPPVFTRGPAGEAQGPGSGPVVVEPSVDPRIALTQPAYPPAAIRGNQTGTVLLSIQVLADGRVGEVRVEQSSGYPLLDRAAVREARRWRLRPGARDGVPTPMWKQVPVKFTLNEVRF